MDSGKQINKVQFMYNGIKIDEDLKKGFFSRQHVSSLENGSVMTEQITFYMDKYSEHLPKELFEVENETDAQRDYYDKDKVRFTLDNKYYEEAFNAWRKAEEKKLKRLITTKEKALSTVPMHKKEEFLKEYENTKEKLKDLLLEEIPSKQQAEILVNTVPEIMKGENRSGLSEYQKRFASGERAADIMNDMEKQFAIPMINNEDYNKKNVDVIELYRKIADSRINNNEKEAFQGYAYEKNSDKATVVNGKTEDEILRKLNGWNAARTESNKFVSCNIATFNAETAKYDKVRRFDVVSGKDITPIYLELPKLEKEQFKRLTEGLKAEGAKYNSFIKQWFITPEQNAETFKKYLPVKEGLGEKVELESKLDWNNINFSTTKVQYVFNVEYAKQNISENIIIESARNLDSKELINALENVLTARNPDRFTLEQLEILNKVKGNTIFAEEEKNLLYNPELTPGQMHEIKSALESGLLFEQVKQFALTSVEPWQMNFYQYGIEHGVSFREMEKIVAPKLKLEEEWSHRKNEIDNLVAEKRGLIAKDLEKNGFEVKASTVKKIERLNFLNNKMNSVKDISNLFRNKDRMQDGEEVKTIVKDIGNELKNQQILQNKSPVMEV